MNSMNAGSGNGMYVHGFEDHEYDNPSSQVQQSANVFLQIVPQSSPNGARRLELRVQARHEALQDARNGKGDWWRKGMGIVAAGLGLKAGAEALITCTPDALKNPIGLTDFAWGDIVKDAIGGAVLFYGSYDNSPDQEELQDALEAEQQDYAAYVQSLNNADRADYLEDASRDAPVACIEALANSPLVGELPSHANVIAARIIKDGYGPAKMQPLFTLAPLVTDSEVARALVGWLLELGGAVKLKSETAGLWRRFITRERDHPARLAFFDEHLATMNAANRERVLERMAAING